MTRYVFRNNVSIILIPSDNGMRVFISDGIMSMPRQLELTKMIFTTIDYCLIIWRHSILSDDEKKSIHQWLVQNGVHLKSL